MLSVATRIQWQSCVVLPARWQRSITTRWMLTILVIVKLPRSMLSKMPTMAAMCYKYSIGQPFVYPRNDLSYAGNFLNMMFSTPCEPYEVNPILERAMDRILILHADHEQNASTSTVRTAGSSGANPFACIAAGIASLWGPAHGGANEAALKMLEEISSVKHIPEFVRRAKDKMILSA